MAIIAEVRSGWEGSVKCCSRNPISKLCSLIKDSQSNILSHFSPPWTDTNANFTLRWGQLHIQQVYESGAIFGSDSKGALGAENPKQSFKKLILNLSDIFVTELCLLHVGWP